MEIFFNVNPLGLEGLGATLTSLIHNCSSPEKLNLTFLCSDLTEQDKSNISTLLGSLHFEGEKNYFDFEAKQIFGHLSSLHGDWTAYGRLLISNYTKADRVLYLDSDLIVLTDVLEIEDFDFGGHVLAAVYGSAVSWTFDAPFFINTLKWDPDTNYFNSGIIYFDLKKWREEGTEKKWKEFAEKYPNNLTSADQTVLNGICKGEYAILPANFNSPWNLKRQLPKLPIENSIVHFVGSPKPWDFLGNLIHPGYKTWRKQETEFWRKRYGKITSQKMYRTWKIRKSLLRHLKEKFVSKISSKK
jgi:lipopolysaccharide biosynthesis glycosyltransferase